MKEMIRDKISSHLTPIYLDIEDQSHFHKGHMGHQENGETHFKIVITTEKFINLTKVARHRLVYEILSNEMRDKIHALSISAYTAKEFNLLTK